MCRLPCNPCAASHECDDERVDEDAAHGWPSEVNKKAAGHNKANCRHSTAALSSRHVVRRGLERVGKSWRGQRQQLSRRMRRGRGGAQGRAQGRWQATVFTVVTTLACVPSLARIPSWQLSCVRRAAAPTTHGAGHDRPKRPPHDPSCRASRRPPPLGLAPSGLVPPWRAMWGSPRTGISEPSLACYRARPRSETLLPRAPLPSPPTLCHRYLTRTRPARPQHP